jgi:hypothetical protein
MIATPIDGKAVRKLLPKSFDNFIETYTLNVLSEFSVFQSAPGSDQLNEQLSELFVSFMKIVSLFWWKTETDQVPYYKTTFRNGYSSPVYDFDDESDPYGNYYDGNFSTNIPCLPNNFSAEYVFLSNFSTIGS